MSLQWSRFINSIGVACALYHIAVNSGLLIFADVYISGAHHAAVSLFWALTLIYLTKAQTRGYLPWYDVVLMVAGLSSVGFVVLFHDEVIAYGKYGFLDIKGMVLAFVLAAVVLETVRRRVGVVLPALLGVAVVATMLNNYLPGLLRGPGFSPDRMAFTLYAGEDGFFSTPLKIASTVVITFLIVAQMLHECGMGAWFSKLAIALTGWMRGGPAKSAVVASAFFGTMSGSPTGNCATTGALTIPLMKSVGYKPSFAGAVEACSSAGGQILPPVMGAIAFLMAEWIGVSYAEVALAAILPATLYFATIFIGVDLEAAKTNLVALKRSEIPDAFKTLREGWFYLIPIAVLIYLLLGMRLYPTISGLCCLPIVIVCSFLSKDKSNRMYPKKILRSLVAGVHSWLTIAVVTAGIGMLIGPMTLSGIGIKISGFLLELTGGNFAATLAVVGLTALVLGMGMDSLPAYITAAALAAPALIMLGMPEISAHLFVIYWALASHITPPVCLTVYVACGISGSGIWKTGWQAMRLGVAKYFVPFVFAFSPALLLMGSAGETVTVYVMTMLGLGSLTAGFVGYSLKRLHWGQRGIYILVGLMLLAPDRRLSLLGLGIAVSSVLWEWRHRRHENTAK